MQGPSAVLLALSLPVPAAPPPETCASFAAVADAVRG
jgi:hypothetical protein